MFWYYVKQSIFSTAQVSGECGVFTILCSIVCLLLTLIFFFFFLFCFFVLADSDLLKSYPLSDGAKCLRGMTQILLSSNGMFLCGSLSHQNAAMFSTHSLKRNPDNPIQFKSQSQKHPILPFILELFYKLSPISPFFFIHKRSSLYSYFASLLQLYYYCIFRSESTASTGGVSPSLVAVDSATTTPFSEGAHCLRWSPFASALVSLCWCIMTTVIACYCGVGKKEKSREAGRASLIHFSLLCLNPPHYDFYNTCLFGAVLCNPLLLTKTTVGYLVDASEQKL